MCTAQDLTNEVKAFQRRTGQETMLVIVEGDDQQIRGLHHVGFDPALGLLVDGRPPSVAWYQHLDSFRALDMAPAVLH
jgi:hypothetical protein